jgi:hypothetical protein
MPMAEHDKVLLLLIEMRDYEKLLFEIYTKLSSIFKENYIFWHEIAVDENTHAFMVDTFISLYRDHYITFQDRSFPALVIEDETQKLRTFSERIETEEISIKEALKFSMQAENSIIERDIFAYKDNDPAEFKKLLSALYDDTKRHYRKIKDFYQNNFET